MCKILGDYKEATTFTGYKIARKIDRRYYSSLTGIEYVVGKIPVDDKVVNTDALGLIWDREAILLPGGQYYDERMVGKTMVFNKLIHCKICRVHPDVILEMTLGGELVEGAMEVYMGNDLPTIAGTEILNIKEINE